MLSPYRISPNNVKKRTKKPKIDDIGDLKRPQMTSNDVKTSLTKQLKVVLYKVILKLMNTI